MKHSLKPGTKPLVSKELSDLLADDSNDEDIDVCNDEFDKIIAETSLRIKKFEFDKNKDRAIFTLSNGQIIRKRLSMYPELMQANDYDLFQYKVSDYGIHWPEIDTDFSLRGFLMEVASNKENA